MSTTDDVKRFLAEEITTSKLLELYPHQDVVGAMTNMIDELRGHISAMSAGMGMVSAERDQLRAQVAELTRRNQMLVSSLVFYAASDSYEPVLGAGLIPVLMDSGDDARKAIQGQKATKQKGKDEKRVS